MNKKIGRPSKITDEMKLQLADFIRSGLTIKDACCGAGISTVTFNRRRSKDSEFDKMIIEATKGGWENAKALAKYCQYRSYKRKNPPILSFQPEKPYTAALRVPQEHSHSQSDGQKRQTIAGLPVLFVRPTDATTGFYVNGLNGQVERKLKDGTLQSMRLAVYKWHYLGHEQPSLLELLI